LNRLVLPNRLILHWCLRVLRAFGCNASGGFRCVAGARRPTGDLHLPPIGG